MIQFSLWRRRPSLIPFFLWIPTCLSRLFSMGIKPTPDLHALSVVKDELSVAKQRLQARLEPWGLRQHEVAGDGNCLFAAVSHQYYGDVSHATTLRERAVSWMRQNANLVLPNGAELSAFSYGVPDWEKYCDDMARPGSWGDHVVLIALSNVRHSPSNLALPYRSSKLGSSSSPAVEGRPMPSSPSTLKFPRSTADQSPLPTSPKTTTILLKSPARAPCHLSRFEHSSSFAISRSILSTAFRRFSMLLRRLNQGVQGRSLPIPFFLSRFSFL